MRVNGTGVSISWLELNIVRRIIIGIIIVAKKRGYDLIESNYPISFLRQSIDRSSFASSSAFDRYLSLSFISNQIGYKIALLFVNKEEKSWSRSYFDDRNSTGTLSRTRCISWNGGRSTISFRS